MRRVYVLIVNWNGWADTLECLESVFRLDYPDFRVIVCDNGSSDGSLERLVAWAEGSLPAPVVNGDPRVQRLSAPPVGKPLDYAVYEKSEGEVGGILGVDPGLVVIRTGDNLGFAGGNNVGLRYLQARGDAAYVWLLNNDTVVETQALSALVARMAEKEGAGICGSTLVLYDHPERVQARGGGWYCRWIGLPWHIGQLGGAGEQWRSEQAERWMNYVVGASMLVSREFLSDVGLMCEDYFLYFEEADWVVRAGKRYNLAYAPQSIVYHKVGRSIGTRTDPRHKSALCDFYAIRNRLLFTRRHYPVALPTVWLTVLTAVLVRLLLGRPERARMLWQLLLGRQVAPPAPGEVP